MCALTFVKSVSFSNLYNLGLSDATYHVSRYSSVSSFYHPFTHGEKSLEGEALSKPTSSSDLKEVTDG